MSQYWSRKVNELTPYTPGEQPKMDNLVKLNTNENPYGPSPRVLQAIADITTKSLRKYPDPSAQQLRQSIAEYYALEINQVFVGNSSDEVLGHIFQGLLKHGKPLCFPDITYSFYPVYCRLFEIDFREIPLSIDFHLDLSAYPGENGGIIFANPNAPTGMALPVADIEALLQRNTESVIVVDEAYVDFGAETAITLINRYPNLLVTQTLSKSRSLAGLRVGLALGQADLIEALQRVKNSFHPFALSSLALAGAQAAFADENYFNQTRDKIIRTREHTRTMLMQRNFMVLPSLSNFVLVKHENFPAQDLFRGLRKQGIVVRHFDQPRVRDYLRISIGTDAEMQSLIAVIDQLITQRPGI